MKNNLDLKRKILGLLCLLWAIGLPFLMGVKSDGLYWGTILFFTRTIFYYLLPPYMIWLLPTLFTGIYQIFARQEKSLDKAILYGGLILTIIASFIFFLTPYNPSTPHEYTALVIVVGAGLLILLNALWNFKVERKWLLNARIIAIILITIFLFTLFYSAVYGRPFVDFFRSLLGYLP
ncbi:MAG: hypothetical protein PHD13_06885 [Methanocellales archaeon]|nr:hypothetical protein [Methanocellales archaeon]MDD3291988.1 hypothetical protein [Methanocellales archaeon]MDD5235884.1 hypothetical protein [Methanocellales archaeon]MDD5485457.1 hypothetical protein [Methanocellales archaeon]